MSNCCCDKIFNLKFKLLVYKRMGNFQLGTPKLIISISIGFLSKLAAASCGFRIDASKILFGFPLEHSSFDCLVFLRRFHSEASGVPPPRGCIVARKGSEKKLSENENECNDDDGALFTERLLKNHFP